MYQISKWFCVLTVTITSLIHAQDQPKPTWSIQTAYPLPESVYFNPHMGLLIVSHVNGGGPLAKDGDGCLSLYSVEGKLISKQWITGLNAPKGSRANGNILWVSDIDRMVCIDTAQGKIINTVNIPGSKFLNDVAITDDGIVYVSDMMDDKIYKIKDGKAALFVEVGRPNGVLLDGERLLVAGRHPIQKEVGCVLAVDLKTKAITPVCKMPTHTLDGFESDGKGGFFISDWDAGQVHHVDPNRKVQTILTTGKGSADIGFNPLNKQLLVPMMVNQRIDAYNAEAWLKN